MVLASLSVLVLISCASAFKHKGALPLDQLAAVRDPLDNSILVNYPQDWRLKIDKPAMTLALAPNEGSGYLAIGVIPIFEFEARFGQEKVAPSLVLKSEAEKYFSPTELGLMEMGIYEVPRRTGLSYRLDSADGVKELIVMPVDTGDYLILYLESPLHELTRYEATYREIINRAWYQALCIQHD